MYNQCMFKKLLIALCIFAIAGCAQETITEDQPQSTIETVVVSESEYDQMYANIPSYTSVTKAMQRSYDIQYSDGSMQTFDMDGVWREDVNNTIVEYSQNINSNGMQSQITGTYIEDTSYNTYNGVTYYEQMSLDQLKESILVPIEYIYIDSQYVESTSQNGSETQITFEFRLNENGRKTLFDQRYDVYGLTQYDTYSVTQGIIRQTFDLNTGYMVSETSQFQAEVIIDDITIEIDARTNCESMNFNQTDIVVTDSQLQEYQEYVSFIDIDTDAISDADITADEPGENGIETFQKRLVSRLGYTQIRDGYYESIFNDNESYTVDFNNNQFIWENYTSSYVYNWKGDTGGFGSSCSYNFETDRATDDCDESVLEQIKNVKSYLMMELYYCGLSLDDIANIQ